MPYTKWFSDWKDANSATGGGDETTPLDQAALDHIETGIDDAHTLIDDHIADTADAHDASAVSVLDAAAQFTGDNVETVLAEIQDNLDAHLADTTDAHDASAISLADTANDFTADNVESAIAEIQTDIEALSAGGGSSTPTGVVAAFAGSAAPTGWLMCDGATASTATYSSLYALIGTTYGATGSGYFTLPDFRGRVAVGKGTHTSVDALGETEGVTAVGNRRPQHRHTPHAHTLPFGSGGLAGGGTGAPYNFTSAYNTGNADGGSGTSTDSLDAPAYLVMNYIIKT